MDKGMANAQISKTLRIPESTIRYQRKSPNNPICKRSSKRYQKIYRLAFNKTKIEIPSGIITIKINENLKKNNEWNKNWKLLSISNSKVDNIFGKK